MPSPMLTTINFPDIAVIGMMVTILGLFVKRWVNGTSKRLEVLTDIKMDKEMCEKVHGSTVDDIQEIKGSMEKMNDKLEDIHNKVLSTPTLQSFQYDLRRLIQQNEALLRRETRGK